MRARAVENAERALKIRTRILESLELKLERAIQKEDTAGVAYIQTEISGMLKDVENRGFGTPTQQVQLTGADGGPIESISAEMTPEQAAEIYRRTLTGEDDSGDSEE